MFFRRIIYILLILLVVALGFQLARTFIFTRFISNTNETIKLDEPASAIIPENINLVKYLVLWESDEINSAATMEQIEKVLQYMKIDYDVIDLTDEFEFNLENYDCIILSMESLDLLGEIQDYTDFVNEGGKIIFAIRPVIDTGFKSISGFLAIDEYQGLRDDSTGIVLEENIFIGIEKPGYELDFIQNSSINAKLDPGKDIELYLNTDEGIPLLWSTGYGDGKFIIFNGTMLNEKNNRGLLSNIISLSQDIFIYPIANIKMIHIDDFPAPIPMGTDKAIMEEFNRTIPQFYREVWWADMLRLAKRYGLVYSGFVIENYGDTTEPPFESSSGRINEENLLIYGKELLNLGGEIGIHGYNHQSLAQEGYIKQDLGYNSWANQDDMEESIRKLIAFIQNVFNNYSIRSYVPPSNILSSTGRSAVISAAGELEIIAGVYLPNYEGDIYEQEFEIAPDGIVEFPRISSGYYNEAEVMWSIYNALNTHGILAHFIHPDDILDPVRSREQSWSVMIKEFESILDNINKDFSWLEGYTISEGALELKKYLEIKPYIEYVENEINIYCQYFRPDAYFIMRTDKEIIDSANIEYEKFWEDAYILTLKEAQGKIILEE